jgi:hypothetical protein
MCTNKPLVIVDRSQRQEMVKNAYSDTIQIFKDKFINFLPQENEVKILKKGTRREFF